MPLCYAEARSIVILTSVLGMTVDERVSDEFKKTVLKAGEYSLNQLQAKFETALFKPERSVYGDKTWAQFPVNIQDGLTFCFTKLKKNLLDRLKGAEKLGSVLKSNKDQGNFDDHPALSRLCLIPKQAARL